jgi:glycosyltransferase involved in cell wall biosynthesis
MAALRVLQVSAFFAAHGGGIEVVAAQLAQRWPALGLEVRWLAGGHPGEAPAADTPGLHCEQARSWDPLERRIGLPFPLWSLGSLRNLWRAVRWSQVVQVHDYLYLPSLAALLFARLLKRPVLLTQHIGPIPFRSALPRLLLATLNRTLGRWALGSAAQVAFVGQPVKAYFAPRVRYRRPPLLLANGVDHARFHAAARPARTAGSPVELLFVGRFVEKKGLRLLRAAVNCAGAHWTFIGWGPEGPETWSASEREGLRLPGRLPPERIVQAYQLADLLVLPSTGEGFPLVVQEALACGTPVLVSREVFEAFPAHDPACVFEVELRGTDAASALRARIEELVADPDRLAAARPHAVALAAQWNWDVCAERYAQLHRELAGALG